MPFKNSQIVIASPFLVLAVNFALAYLFGTYVGKWAFVPMILFGWMLWLFFILNYGGKEALGHWLKKPSGPFAWNILAIIVGLIPLPLFLMHYHLLAPWTVWLPWIVLALVNPWIEEFYWRGLLLDHTGHWPQWAAVLYTSLFFALNHAAFGINSMVNSGPEVVLSTFIMGTVWALLYIKTKSLRWAIFSHFLVDFLGVSSVAFLDLFEKGAW